MEPVQIDAKASTKSVSLNIVYMQDIHARPGNDILKQIRICDSVQEELVVHAREPYLPRRFKGST